MREETKSAFVRKSSHERKRSWVEDSFFSFFFFLIFHSIPFRGGLDRGAASSGVCFRRKVEQGRSSSYRKRFSLSSLSAFFVLFRLLKRREREEKALQCRQRKALKLQVGKEKEGRKEGRQKGKLTNVSLHVFLFVVKLPLKSAVEWKEKMCRGEKSWMLFFTKIYFYTLTRKKFAVCERIKKCLSGQLSPEQYEPTLRVQFILRFAVCVPLSW